VIETPAAHGPPLFSAVLKSHPDDFKVSEILSVEFDGQGEHLWLHLEKQNLGTLEMLDELQKLYRVSSVDVGYSGLKDRRATTRQWISIRTPLDADILDIDGVRLLDSARHGRKLRHGAHSANQFEIVLRKLQWQMQPDTANSAARELLHHRLEQLNDKGFPNYLGPQRFGHGARNLKQAEDWFRRPKRRLSRAKRGFLLSAARSALFNLVCAERVRQDCWDVLLPGEPAILKGSRSFFVPEPDDVEAKQRCAEQDIHPSAPWWGRGASLALLDCARFETDVLEPYDLLREGLERAGLDQQRRAIRATPSDLSHRWIDEKTLDLKFTLGSGVFATTVLAECGTCVQQFDATDEEGAC